jgi:SOS response regulatory protein OraA/RecX
VAESAYQAALKILSRRDYFVAELRKRLVRKEFDADEIDDAIRRCVGFGLLDDQRVARRFIELCAVSRGWGPHRLEAELRHRGVDDGLATVTARLEPSDLVGALDTALRRAEIRAPDAWWRLSDRRARMISSLIARGFEASDAIDAVERLAAARENPHDALDDQ